MSYHRREKEEEGGSCPFKKLDKTTLYLETWYFNSTPVNPRKCIHILSKILYLLNQGEELTTQEATNFFFATTKLFQCKDVVLRRLVYLTIKELSSLAQDVFIVTSSLTKDVTGNEDLYRGAAIRALCSITDTAMLQAVERYFKQAIVDKNPAVSSAALVSAYHLSAAVPDLTRRWVNEAQGAVTSDNSMVSYHALGVLAAARRNDRLSTIKLITSFCKAPHTTLRSPYATCLLIRYAAEVVAEDQTELSGSCMSFIENCLRHKSEMVVYEAAHAIVNLKHSAKDLAQAISVLQIFCGSSKATLRLAGARSLAKLTIKHPTALATCAVDLENLITDPNRSVATLAVTTLLASGAESSIDRLLKLVSNFMTEIPDEFKIIVVRAIKGLCSKFPLKHQLLSSVLAGMLRDEGGLEFKTAVADTIISLVQENPDARETGLAHLCEFIEDCEHTSLAVRILHVLGREGPKARQPSKYIRYIYNRIILESGPVRAAAVSTLAHFGAERPELLPNIKVLLARCHLDDDDEVRDRAVYYSTILETEDPQLISDYIVNVPLLNPIVLEKALKDHLDMNPSEPFNIDTVPIIEVALENEGHVKIEVDKQLSAAIKGLYTEQLNVIPGIVKFGPIFKTCEPIDLTEPETEYRVRCVKHIFSRHLVLQFECLNTLSDQLLVDVHVLLEVPPGYVLLEGVACESLPFDKKGSVFWVLEFPTNPLETLGTFGATLEFVVQDYDSTTGVSDTGGGYADTYPLEEIEVGFTEQFRWLAETGAWELLWETATTAAEGSDSFGLSQKNVGEAANAETGEWELLWERAATAPKGSDTFGLSQTNVGEAAIAVCEHLGLPKSAITGEAVKEIRGGGTWRQGTPVLIRARLVAAQGAVTMQLDTRSPREDIATLVLVAVG